MAGFLDAAARPQVLRGVTVDAPDKVMAAAVTALLGPEEAGPTEVRATANEGLRLMREGRKTLLSLITTNQETKRK